MMPVVGSLVVVVVLSVVTVAVVATGDLSECGGDNGGPMRKCEPPLENVALHKPVRASETCRDEKFTRWHQTASGGIRGSVEWCRAGSHPPSHVNDISNPSNHTYWQSRSMSGREDREVTVTISFGKEYELSYVYVSFNSPRPRAMAIYKSQDGGRSWQPYQYFARDCLHRFGVRARETEEREVDNEVMCSEQHSAPTPLTGGSVVFNPTTNGGRDDLDNKYIRQEWVTATDIKIKLIALNNPLQAIRSSSPKTIRNSSPLLSTSTTRQEEDNEPSGYYYAINNVAVGARCKCNGHASRCVPIATSSSSRHADVSGGVRCDCEHNTAGDNCEKCRNFFHDQPWRRATNDNPNPCVVCNCNNHSNRCRYSPEVYVKSGRKSGTLCHHCRHHTTGTNCQYCKEGYFRSGKNITHPRACRPCKCHPVGSVGTECNPITGECLCKTGVTGRRCARCAKGYVQTQSTDEPCGPKGMPPTAPAPVTPSMTECRSPCQATSVSITRGRFCSFDYVLSIDVISVQEDQVIGGNRFVSLSGAVQQVFKRERFRMRRGNRVTFMIRKRAWQCLFCQHQIYATRRYMVFGSYQKHAGAPRSNAVRVHPTMDFFVVVWDNEFKRRMRRMHKRVKKYNTCNV